MINMPMRAAGDAFHEAWRLRWPFLLSHLVFSLLVLAVLAPATSLALRAALVLSGKPALSDFDIALFLLSPVGILAALAVASLILTSVVLDSAFMMAIALHARRTGERRFDEGVSRIVPRIPQIIGFSWRLLLRIVGIAAPFLVAALFVAQQWLTEFDINYYLSQHPPEFVRAAIIIGLVLAAMAAVLARALMGWAIALPLILFEGVHPRDSFAASARAMRGQRWDLFLAVLAWAAIGFVAITLVLGALRVAAGGLTGLAGSDLSRLAAALLVAAAVTGLVNLLISAVTTGALANLLMERAGWPGTEGADAGNRADRHWLRRVLLVGVAVAVVFTAIGGFDLATFQTQDKVQIIAHRGAAGQRPENTMASFRKAIEDGADWVELDVQESAEGEIIVVHDSDFMKLAGVDLKAWDATAADLAGIDIGSWFAPEYADERTPTLREVLELAKGTESGILIELKYYDHDQKLEERVAALVEETGMVDHVRIMSLKYEGVQKMKALRPDWTVGLLAAASVGRLWELDADFLAVNMGMANLSLVKKSREAGKELHVWTVNDPLAMSRMLSLGVSGLITDEPALAREIVAERADLGTLERLVLALGNQVGLKVSDKVYRDGSP